MSEATDYTATDSEWIAINNIGGDPKDATAVFALRQYAAEVRAEERARWKATVKNILSEIDKINFSIHDYIVARDALAALLNEKDGE